MNLIEYKNYIGNIEVSIEDDCLFGKVQGIKSLISYEGTTVDEIIKDFHNSVDNYLETCKENNIEPEKAYKGTFNVRIKPETHKKIATYAMEHNTSLNNVVEESLNFIFSSPDINPSNIISLR